jgi:hypothetical protein
MRGASNRTIQKRRRLVIGGTAPIARPHTHEVGSPKPMLWIYERSNETLRIETRFDNATNEYVLITRRVDGTEQVERFPDAPSFQTRLDSLERQLEAEEWRNRSVTALHDGWKL